MPGPPGGLESGRERPFEVCWDIGGRNRGRYRVSTPRSVALFVDPLSRHEKWCRAVPPGSQPRPVCYAALLFLSNASSTSLSTLSSPPGSSGRGSRS